MTLTGSPLTSCGGNEAVGRLRLTHGDIFTSRRISLLRSFCRVRPANVAIEKPRSSGIPSAGFANIGMKSTVLMHH